MDITGIGSIFDFGAKLVDKLFPNAAERDIAKLELIKMQQSGELALVQTQLSAILAEANSVDPWTSRARPSFMYVIYILILMGVPMGFVSAWKPDVAVAVAHGLQLWLAAIPDSLYTLFGVGYLGYTGSRTLEKVKGVS